MCFRHLQIAHCSPSSYRLSLVSCWFSSISVLLEISLLDPSQKYTLLPALFFPNVNLIYWANNCTFHITRSHASAYIAWFQKTGGLLWLIEVIDFHLIAGTSCSLTAINSVLLKHTWRYSNSNRFCKKTIRNIYSNWLLQYSISCVNYSLYFDGIQEFQSPEAGLCWNECAWDESLSPWRQVGACTQSSTPFLIPTGLIPRSAPEWMKHHARAVLTSSFRFALWMKNIVRKPLFIFWVNELKVSPRDQQVLSDPSWKAANYWAEGGIVRVRQHFKETSKILFQFRNYQN